MKHIGIIGAGFSGIFTAIQLIKQATSPIEITIISEKASFGRGIAYTPYSKKHLLNVITQKMSAFGDDPNHFLDWVMSQDDFKEKDREVIANSFMPRYLYGEYMDHVRSQYISLASSKNIKYHELYDEVQDIEIEEGQITLTLSNSQNHLIVNECVLASGNILPRNPNGISKSVLAHPNYYQNPWEGNYVRNIDHTKPILIIGNGLTMVDSVLGLLEHGYQNQIISVSPNGFNILPHRHNGLHYKKLAEEMPTNGKLYDYVKLIFKHVRLVREHGVSAEPVIDSIRPFTQKIWKSLSESDKALFMSRFRHLWGVARHRIPLHIHDLIQKLRIQNRLEIISGKIVSVDVAKDEFAVTIFDKKRQRNLTTTYGKIINCTGPETDISKLENGLLVNIFKKGYISQDPLCLGIRTNPDNFCILDRIGKEQAGFYTLGSNLKGELWESTAVNELRSQCERLASLLLKND